MMLILIINNNIINIIIIGCRRSAPDAAVEARHPALLHGVARQVCFVIVTF